MSLDIFGPCSPFHWMWLLLKVMVLFIKTCHYGVLYKPQHWLAWKSNISQLHVTSLVPSRARSCIIHFLLALWHLILCAFISASSSKPLGSPCRFQDLSSVQLLLLLSHEAQFPAASVAPDSDTCFISSARLWCFWPSPSCSATWKLSAGSNLGEM